CPGVGIPRLLHPEARRRREPRLALWGASLSSTPAASVERAPRPPSWPRRTASAERPVSARRPRVTLAPDGGPPVVGVRRPACWAGGQDHDEASPSHTRADRAEAARGRPVAERGQGPRRGAAAARGVRVE